MKRGMIKVQVALLIIVMLAAMLSAAVIAEGSTEPAKTLFDAVKTDTSSILRPGSSAKLTIMVHFIDGVVADLNDYNENTFSEKAMIHVTGFSSDSIDVTEANSLLPQPLLKIDNEGWAEISYQVKINSLYNRSSVTLKFSVSYDGETQDDSFILLVDNRQPDPIIFPDPPALPDPTAALISVVPSSVTIQAGKSAKVSFEVVNSGERGASNLTATLTPVGSELQRLLDANPPAAFTAHVSSVRRNSSANSGNRGTFSYNLTVPNTLKSGVYEFRVTGSFYHEISNNLGTFDGSIQVVVINDFEPVSMQITEVGPLHPIHPGELFNINIQVQNTGGLAAREVSLSVKNLSESSFSMVGSASAGVVGQVGAGQTGNRTLSLRAAAKMEPGTWPIVVSLSYVDADDRLQTTEYQAFIEVLGEPELPETELEMIRASIPGGIIKPGQRAVLSIELRNPSTAAAENVRVKVSGFSGTGLYLTDSENNLPAKTVESIASGARATVTYDVILSDMCNIPALALQAEISYKSPDGSIKSFTENISFPVLLPPPEEPTPPPDTSTSTPKLILDRYSMSWDGQPIQTLRAGAMFDLTFTLRNTSVLTNLSNITVTLSSVDGVFMPAAGSNTFYIEEIEAGGETERTIRLVVAQNAETKSYQLNFNLDYEDEDGAAYRPGETLSLPVVVPLIVELNNFNPPMWAEMGSQTYMTFNYINKGKGTVYNFTIDIEGDFMLPDGSSYYIGNLVSGYIDWFECMLIPMASGDVTGAVVLSFEDAVGNLTVMREEFTVSVSEPYYPEFPMDDFPGMFPIEPGTESSGGLFGMSLWLTIVCGAGIVVVLLVTFLLIRRSRIKKRRALEEDDDFEDGNGAD